MSKQFGIDISEFQTGVDYARAVNEGGVRFAILRSGYSTSPDAEFAHHYRGFADKIPLGAYCYSYARNPEQAKLEAQATLRICKGKKFSLPLYLDMEERAVYNLGKEACMKIAVAWADAISKGGFTPGVYASESWFNNVLDAKVLADAGLNIWIASWGTAQPKNCNVWQFGGEVNLVRPKTVAGINGTVDQDYLYDKEDGIEPPEENSKGDDYVTVKLRVLVKGMAGTDVRTMQRLLVGAGYGVGPAGCDGDFGNDTRAALMRFQLEHSLVADGICGAKTWPCLLGV